MNDRIRKILMVATAPLITGLLLGGMALENGTHIKPQNVEAFHNAARAALDEVPYTIGSWVGKDEAVPTEAVKLLRPNRIISRTYVDVANVHRRASLLIVQCRDSRDMMGHYPPICYPGQGEVLISARKRDWKAGDMTIPGMEYLFERRGHEYTSRRYVYDFMIVPGVPIIRDMDGVFRAAEDYQRRYFGAAQFQVVMSGDLTETERDEIFNVLVGANTRIIHLLQTGGITK